MSKLFEKPTTPKNSLQLLQWLIFEPILLRRYEESLDETQINNILFKSLSINFFIIIVPLTLVIYLISVVIIAGFDLPLYKNTLFVQQWQNYTTFWDKIYFFVSFDDYRSLKDLALSLAIGFGFSLALGFTISLTVILSGGLTGGLAGSLALCLTLCLTLGLTFSLAFDLAFDLAFGLAFGFAGGVALSLAFGLGFGFAGGVVLSLAFGLGFGLFFSIFFYISYFRLWLYPWHFIKSLIAVNFTNNPYIGDGVIWLPIWGITGKLTNLAQQDPKTGLAFVNFLQEYRPLQKQLAMHIAHASTAGNWQYHPLKQEYFLPPPLIKETPKLTPSEDWLNKFEKLKNQFISYDEEHHISLQKEQLINFNEQLQKFRNLTILEPYRWHQYYLPALDQWLTAAKERLVQLTQDAEREEPITLNIYRYGDILDPDRDQKIFFGRNDLKLELQHEIITARTMPMFLCYGQRRVGKTSLLKFLPRLLGSRFQVIDQDCQSGKIYNLQSWLQDLHQNLNKIFKSTIIDWQQTDNWLQVWNKMQTYLETLSEKHEEKIILAFDEYEELHKRIFSTDPQQGKMLLGAMRSFSQQQNQIVFLFIGGTQFADLKNPNWSNYFIHAMPLRVDYLKPQDATRLITEPVDLNYPNAVIERMLEVTQGHPALLQMLCRYMVTIANTESRKNMTLEDLEQVITNKIVQPHIYALETFWTEFCENYQCHTTVEEILNQQPITNKRNLFKLKNYGYIIPDGDNWKFRVPLLEMWLREYREGCEIT